MVEVARLQADRRCVRQAATSGGEENVAAPETPEDACEVGEATGDTEANASHDVKAEAPKDSPPTAKKEAVVVPPRPQEYVELDSERRAPIRLVALERRLPRPFPGEVMGPTSQGCWRYGGPDHFFRECPRRRNGCAVKICYRCGSLDTTVRNCPNCREGWLAQGPYIQGRGHAGPELPRRRGLPCVEGRTRNRRTKERQLIFFPFLRASFRLSDFFFIVLCRLFFSVSSYYIFTGCRQEPI